MLTQPSSSGPLRHQLILIFISGATFFTNLGGIRLLDRDEPRNAGCAREMMERGDWIVPTFNAELRSHKPVLTYWFMMSAYSVLGVSEFAARFWSAIFGMGTVLLTYHIGRRLLSAEAAFWGALATATSIWFAIAARIATPDSILIFFVTLPIYIYVRAVWPRENMVDPGRTWFPSSWLTAAGMYASMGLAMLAKGPVGLVLPTAVIGMFMLIIRLPGEVAKVDRRPRWKRVLRTILRSFHPRHFLATCWAMRPITALAVALAVSLPWYIAVHAQTAGEFTRGFFLEHHVGRATTVMEEHGGPGPLYYPLVTLVAYFPWSVFVVVAIVDMVHRIRRRDGWSRGYILLACWIGVYIGVFSLARTKLPNYVTPMYPALGLMTGAYLHHVLRGDQRWGTRGTMAALAIYAAVGIAASVAIAVWLSRTLAGSQTLAWLGVIPFVGGGVATWLYWRGRSLPALRVFAGSAMLSTTAVLAWALDFVDSRYQRSEVLLTAIGEATPPGAPAELYCYGVLEPSWVFYGGQPIRELARGATKDQVIELLNRPRAMLITLDRHYQMVKPSLPPGVDVIAQIPHFMRPDTGDVVLIGRRMAP